jgi:hypothetical protein
MQAFFIIGIIAAVALLVIDSIRQYRSTGKIPWWWFLSASPWVVFARVYGENYPDMRYSNRERRIVKVVVRFAIFGLLISILWIPATILALMLLGIESDQSGLIIVPAAVGFSASLFILILRWMLFLTGQMPGNREK